MENFLNCYFREGISGETLEKLQRAEDVDAMLYFSDGTVGRGFLVMSYDITELQKTLYLVSENRRNSEDALLVYPVLYYEPCLVPVAQPEIGFMREPVQQTLQGLIKSTSRGVFKKKPIIAADPEKELVDIRIL